MRAKERHHKNVSETCDDAKNADKLYVHESGLLMLSEGHPEYLNLIRLQLENQELNKWKCQLQNRITAERSEIIRLKGILKSTIVNQPSQLPDSNSLQSDDSSYERLIAHYVKENTLLEQKKNILAKEIFEENHELVQLQVDLAIQKYQI